MIYYICIYILLLLLLYIQKYVKICELSSKNGDIILTPFLSIALVILALRPGFVWK